MKRKLDHEWDVTPIKAQEIQLKLAGLVLRRCELPSIRLVAGVDISAPDGQGVARGAVVVLSYPELTLVETKTATGKISFPYIPGLLSFRESPLLLATTERLSLLPDLILVDGQGLAHPRRLGLASHLGLLWDRPTIGCAKSCLCGQHGLVGIERECYAELIDNNEVIGTALRTKEGTSLLYVSIGHRIDLTAAREWVLSCCRGHRLPEPTRLAHIAASGKLEDVEFREKSHQTRLFG